MSLIGLRVPHETARLLGDIEVPGQRESTSELHITMIYLGKEVPVETLADAMVAVHEVTSRTRPFTVGTSLLTCFKKNDDGVPIICKVESEALHALQAQLKATLRARNIPFIDKYPEYKPHVTLAYAEDTIEDRPIHSIEWGAHELILWGGDTGDQRLIVTFPFTIDRIARRVAQRFSANAEGSRVS